MQADLGVTIRPARLTDARAIGIVHVAAWRSAYPGILPGRTLVGMSAPQQALYYESLIRRGAGVSVAVAGTNEDVIGFTSVGRARGSTLGDGEIYTLYVLDDWHGDGVGRQLMRAAASRLAADGCRSVFLWVLSDNPARWFYFHLGGRPVATGHTPVGGERVPQTAYRWDAIETLTAGTSSGS